MTFVKALRVADVPEGGVVTIRTSINVTQINDESIAIEPPL